jgi:hypothetical protein
VRGTSRAVRLFFVAAAISSGCASRSPVVPTQHADIAAYREARERLIARERAMRLGAELVLSADEEAANRSLMALKRAELERGAPTSLPRTVSSGRRRSS